MEWELHIRYKKTKFVQKATVEYASRQIIRIRVSGSKQGLLLENNYPGIRFTNSKRGVKWKIKEGNMTEADSDWGQLLISIFSQLEHYMKEDFQKIYPDANTL